jgi:hypothetical protein
VAQNGKNEATPKNGNCRYLAADKRIYLDFGDSGEGDQHSALMAINVPG